MASIQFILQEDAEAAENQKTGRPRKAEPWWRHSLALGAILKLKTQ
jgi:hypothetical protein